MRPWGARAIEGMEGTSARENGASQTHTVWCLALPEPHSAHLIPVPFLPCRFDIYRKVPKDLTQPTYTGAISE